MSTGLFIICIIFIPLLTLFLIINVRHNFLNKDKKFEIIASPIYYILIIGLDPHF